MEKRKPQNKKQSDLPVKAVRWMIMLYIAADGNLANFAIESLKQINNSMAIPCGEADEATVLVAAQFAIDAPGGQQIPRYIFDQNSRGSINNSLKEYLNAPNNMTEQEALISFIKWVYAQPPEYQADRYALILWGHGPELLLQPPSGQEISDPSVSQNDDNNLYLSPPELRVALTESLPKGKRLDVLAFDACSMSMFEVAYEVRDHVHYMVASQEEVPDPSFPYDTLVQLFRENGKHTEELLKKGVYAYVGAYEDYICNTTTGMKRVTLSALRLREYGRLRDAIAELSCALLNARKEPSLPPLLVEARAGSRDFVSGLYVDLFDFCKKLRHVLAAGVSEDLHKFELASRGQFKTAQVLPPWKHEIRSACQKVMLALQMVGSPEDTQDAGRHLVLANSSADCRCHGVSLYLPYLCLEQLGEVQQPMVKGGRDTIGKGFSSVLNHAACGLLMCLRRELIVVTESYYEELALAQDTAWYRFIVEVWSRILVELSPDDLDQKYSAQQSAVNAFRTDLKGPQCPGEITPNDYPTMWTRHRK